MYVKTKYKHLLLFSIYDENIHSSISKSMILYNIVEEVEWLKKHVDVIQANSAIIENHEAINNHFLIQVLNEITTGRCSEYTIHATVTNMSCDKWEKHVRALTEEELTSNILNWGVLAWAKEPPPQPQA